MSVTFDARAAEQLIQQMSRYCSGVHKETRALLDVTKDNVDWNDNQAKAFQANVMELAKDLNKVLFLESEYLKTYQERVRELKG